MTIRARGRRRLHRRLGQMREVIFGFQPLGRSFQGGLDIAVVAHHLAGLAGGLFQFGFVRLGIVAAVRPLIPFQLEGLAALDGRPGVAGDHGYAAERVEIGGRRTAFQFQHPHHPRHLEGIAGVVFQDFATEHRRPRHHRVQHALEAGIDAVLATARNQGRSVVNSELALADIAEFRRVLQMQTIAGGRRQPGGGPGQLAVAQRPAAGRMQDPVLLGADFPGRHPPLRGGRRFQHLPRRRAHPAHRRKEVAHAARTVGILVAVTRFVAGGLPDADLPPIGFQFVGHHHRQAGADALPHFRAVANDGHHAVHRYRHEHQWVVHPAVRHGVGAVGIFFRGGGGFVRAARRGETGGQHQAGEGHVLEKFAPADVDDIQAAVRVRCFGIRFQEILRVVHGLASVCPAACLMAARIRK